MKLVAYRILNVIADEAFAGYLGKSSILMLRLKVRYDSLLLWFLESDSFKPQFDVGRVERLD
jgi:hypothetical protein